jgi:hypothetical protein
MLMFSVYFSFFCSDSDDFFFVESNDMSVFISSVLLTFNSDSIELSISVIKSYVLSVENAFFTDTSGFPHEVQLERLTC